MKTTQATQTAPLFHAEVFWPARVPTHTPSRLGLFPTRHAIEQATRKGFRLPDEAPAGAALVEVEMVGRHVTKAVLRWTYSDTHDMVAVVRGNTLVTCWLNARGDGHSTLDASKYATGQAF